MQLNIIYEDQNLLVINKPSGISVHKVHPTDPNTTLVDILLESYPEVKDVGENPLRPGIVHRLDKDTSGVMLIAKNQNTFLHFKDLFQTRKMQKHYLALVHGHPKQSSGTIDIPLGKIGTKQTTQIKGKKELLERQALTNYKTLESFKKHTLLEVMPKTGRTHQIRIHLKSIGNPIVGDKIYGLKGDHQKHLFLHAKRLDFTTPDGQSLSIEADPPEEFSQFIQGLAKN
jgi:23S rRNA pseudouridine1911/1915/1917 synthase